MNKTAKLPMSVPDWCFFKDQYTPEHYYARLREIGFAAIEMPYPQRITAVKKAGLPILNLNGPGDLNRLKKHEAAMASLAETLKIAQENDVPQVLVFSGNREGQADEVGLANVIQFLKSAVPLAEAAGVILALEVFNQFDHPGYQADNSAYAFKAARAVASPAVKVLYDIYHMHRMGEDVASVIVNNIELISHLHVAGSPKRDFPGDDQQIDYRDVVDRALAAGYDGLWGMEFYAKGDVLEELAAVYKLFKSFT